MGGRPKKTYSDKIIEQIDALAFEGHKTGTIATLLDLDIKTLETHFSKRMTQKRIEGRVALKKAQVTKALAGDNVMLVWLGKNELEQTDKAENRNVNENTNIEVFANEDVEREALQKRLDRLKVKESTGDAIHRD